MIAERKGFGRLLGEGVLEAAKTVGRGSEQFAMHVKGVGLNEQGVRSHKAWGFGMAVSARGGGHLNGSPQTENRQISSWTGQGSSAMKTPEFPDHTGEKAGSSHGTKSTRPSSTR